MEKKIEYIVRRARKVTMRKLDEFLTLIGYKRRVMNGFGFIRNNYGNETGLITYGDRIEIRNEVICGRKGLGIMYIDLRVCNLEYRQEVGSDWKTLCIYGKKEEEIFLQLYDNRKQNI